VGFVSVVKNENASFLNLYQNAEYIFAQCLKRRLQSLLTKKVSCLSGCVQIIKICEELCGEKILNAFNYLPKSEENIFKHILSYASEDRNHICLAFSLYPHILTIQRLDALAYTKVPEKLSIFLSQRRRWSLGATLNDILLIFKPNIVFLERLNAFINVFTFCLFPFILIASIYFIIALITNRNLLLLYLSIPMIIPFVYGLSIPFFFKKDIKILYFYFGFLIYSTVGFLLNMIIGLYSIYHMDVLKWGKTRQIKGNIIETRV
jgi:chitin synthase